MTTRCTECGATLTWYAGQQFQVCWSCARVTKRVDEKRAPHREPVDPGEPDASASSGAVPPDPNGAIAHQRSDKVNIPRGATGNA